MEKTCKNIEQMLVDYADGLLSQTDTSMVAEHLAGCESCRRIHVALHKSIELAGVIWADAHAEAENIRIPTVKIRKIHWSRYAAIAASILLLATASVVWRTPVKPKEAEPTFEEIERKIIDSSSAARLLAAAELLRDNPKAETIVKQQYQHIVETYPETAAATKAKLRIK